MVVRRLLVRLVVPFLIHAATVDEMPGFPGEDFTVFQKLRIVHGAFSANHDIQLIDLFGFFQKSGRVLTSLGVVVIEDDPVAPHDRSCFAGNLDRQSGLTLLTRLTLAATPTLLRATTPTLLRATTSASTAATTTIAVAIPSLMTGALLIIGTSVQFLSPGAIEKQP
jgi:hypothetical protein